MKYDHTLIYVGDPMCSWCWGIAPNLKKIKEYCEEMDVGFEIVVGGLRPGGGDPWDQRMKDFLRHHWEQVHQQSGQPFNFGLLETVDFNYDTEPACRLVVAARKWLGQGSLDWFSSLQRKFYVESKDLALIENSRGICEEFDIDFEAFREHFLSEPVKQATLQDFRKSRSWEIRGYPSILIRTGDQYHGIVFGYTSFENLRSTIESYLDQLTID